MPERPDLEYVVPRLREALVGRVIASMEVDEPVIVRDLVGKGPPLNHAITAVTRVSHYIVFELAGPSPRRMIVSPMLAGRFSFGPKRPHRSAGAELLRIEFVDGDPFLRYHDDKTMGKFYWLNPGQEDDIPGFSAASRGVDVLSPTFSWFLLADHLVSTRKQIRNVLMDKSRFDAFGNAYADETLFVAGIHPKTPAYKISKEQAKALYLAMQSVMRNAIDHIHQKAPPIEVKLRDFLQVRGKEGQPCPRCGTVLRSIRVNAADAIFCPECQPAAGRKQLVTWEHIEKKQETKGLPPALLAVLDQAQAAGRFKPEKPPAGTKLLQLERKLGLRLPVPYRQFVETFGAARIGQDIDIAGLPTRAGRLSLDRFLAEMKAVPEFPVDLLPIARVGERIICVSTENGSVTAWPRPTAHELKPFVVWLSALL